MQLSTSGGQGLSCLQNEEPAGGWSATISNARRRRSALKKGYMRLIIVSNRLPVTAVAHGKDLIFTPSIGGLATGLSAYLASLKKNNNQITEYLWVGWPGPATDSHHRESISAKSAELHASPVFLSQAQMENFYDGFCNKTLWALFHYFSSYAAFKTRYWINYKEVNQIFCSALQTILKPDDIVWIHDYHLMLLPGLLRKHFPNLPIGFFLHIPFPSFEVYRVLPSEWRSEILEGMLGSDLIGFHTQDYAQYFLRCVWRLLGYNHTMGKILTADHTIQVDAFPMGIDVDKFLTASRSARVTEQIAALKTRFSNTRNILSVDRLDYSKGILNRLRGFEELLNKYPQWQGKVRLLLVVVPSRVGVDRYKTMKSEIDELVGAINGRFASIDWTPVHYQYRALHFEPLVSLYAASDVMLVTPLRDGMNLVAKEYIASRPDHTGVLILSEMAGAAKELGEAIIINPNNTDEITDALRIALEMPEEEQIKRNTVMQARLQRYNVVRWANDFIAALTLLKEKQRAFEARVVTEPLRKQLRTEFLKAKNKLLFIDYDGTLIDFTGDPKTASPPASVLGLLRSLSRVPATTLVLISGRERHSLEKWFCDSGISIVAEHGAWLKEGCEEWRMMRMLTNEWKSQVMSIFNLYADRLHGSFIEEKEYSIAYHYREADPDLGSVRAKELTDNLVHFAANLDVQVLQGSKVVEMRNAGVNKGSAGKYFLSQNAFDFILAIGDDSTDEDLFRILPPHAHSIKVGTGHSHARYNISHPRDVIHLLTELIADD